MKCPYCGYQEDRVLETRVGKDGESIRRRRECLQCDGRFTTVESLLQVYPMIVKKDGRREPFSPEKVRKGIQAACQKRPVSLAQMDQLVERISKWVLSKPERELTADAIGQKVVRELRSVDDVAYVRFASVYKTFRDVSEFVSHLEGEDDEEEALGRGSDSAERSVEGLAGAKKIAKDIDQENEAESV